MGSEASAKATADLRVVGGAFGAQRAEEHRDLAGGEAIDRAAVGDREIGDARVEVVEQVRELAGIDLLGGARDGDAVDAHDRDAPSLVAERPTSPRKMASASPGSTKRRRSSDWRARPRPISRSSAFATQHARGEMIDEQVAEIRRAGDDGDDQADEAAIAHEHRIVQVRIERRVGQKLEVRGDRQRR